MLASLADFGLTEAGLDAGWGALRRVPVGEVRCRVLRRGLPCRGARPPGRDRHAGRKVCAPRLGGPGAIRLFGAGGRPETTGPKDEREFPQFEAIFRKNWNTAVKRVRVRPSPPGTGSPCRGARAAAASHRMREPPPQGNRSAGSLRQPHWSHSCQPTAAYRNPSAGVRACTSSTSTSRETSRTATALPVGSMDRGPLREAVEKGGLRDPNPDGGAGEPVPGDRGDRRAR